MPFMRQIITADDSITFFSDEYQETMHSTTGAKEEAIKKFVEPAKIRERAQTRDSIKILDICFGIGYNSAAAIDAIREENPRVKIIIYAIEKELSVLKQSQYVHSDEFECYEEIQSFISTLKPEQHEAIFNVQNLELHIFIEDARTAIKRLKGNEFDVVFHDAFSPKKCPELWTEQFFKDVYAAMRDKGVLTTYSCAREVRENLRRAKFLAKDGPRVGRRGPSTIAKK